MPERVILFQPALPAYRRDFFDRVARRLSSGFKVRYAATDMGALTDAAAPAPWAEALPPIRRLVPGLDWQPGVLSTPVARGDVVVVSGAPRNLSNMLMLALARLKGARTIWWGHYWSSSSRTHRFFFRLLLMRMADAILFYTDEEVEEYRASHGRRDHRIVTALNNGINVEPIAALREPYDTGVRERVILFIGRLTEKAELPLLLKALADQRLQDVRLEVVGDGSEKGSLETLAKELQVDERIVWHGGTTDEQAIARIANKCRLFVYPGSVGLSLLHAMAYGLPAVVHDDRWKHMPEIAAFHSAKSGLLFKRGDSGSLVKAIVEALDFTSFDHSWPDASIKVADTKFNTREMANRFCTLIEQLRAGTD